jgi:hypothetical protein
MMLRWGAKGGCQQLRALPAAYVSGCKLRDSSRMNLVWSRGLEFAWVALFLERNLLGRCFDMAA